MSKYFSSKETECHCGCGIDNPSPKLMARLDAVREEYGHPLLASCVCRCPEHNEDVGGEDHSAHLTTSEKQGEGADIGCVDSHVRYLLLKIGLKYFNRIEVGDTWLHFDVATDLLHPLEVVFLPKRTQRKQ